MAVTKRLPAENATLDRCVAEAQREQVILTRNGEPAALVVSVADYLCAPADERFGKAGCRKSARPV
jgi:prevent-host-death family protein